MVAVLMPGEKKLEILLKEIKPILSSKRYFFFSSASMTPSEILALEPIGLFKEVEGWTAMLGEEKADVGIADPVILRCISLNVHSSLEAVGLTAAVSAVLAKREIPANVVAGYYHDHIFVPEKDAQNALILLRELSASTA